MDKIKELIFSLFAALQLLEYCYQADDELTQHLLTASLENWSRQTCLRLAVYGNNLRLNTVQWGSEIQTSLVVK